jgi:NADH:ubiquinone reductase (H+-translocating)
VGAGPTGVELAGTLAEIARKSLPEDFRNIQPAKTRVLLVEAGPAVLSAYPDDLRQSAVKQLQRLGVEVRTNSAVTDVRPDAVSIGEEVVPAAAVLWAAGVAASPLGAALGLPRWTAPDGCWSNPTSASPDIARSLSSATSPA